MSARRLTAVIIGVADPGELRYARRSYPFAPLLGVQRDMDEYEAFVNRLDPTAHVIRPREGPATRPDALRKRLRSVVASLEASDLLLVTLIGHATQLPDLDGDEPPSRMDGAFAATGGFILDDFFRRLWASAGNEHAELVVIVDACDADTVAYLDRPRIRSPRWTFVASSHPATILIAAAQAAQTAMEAGAPGRERGVMSAALIDAWGSGEGLSYRQWFDLAATLVGDRSQQVPQLRYLGALLPDDALDRPALRVR